MKASISTFYIVTISQILSIIGSMMTSIALGIWLFNKTGDSTPVLLASFFVALPQALIGSMGGVLADRWQRRHVMILSDLGQALGTIALLISFLSGAFQIWHLYLVAFIQGLLGMLQRPAMEASITMLVPDDQRDRANTLRQITGPIAGIIAPIIAGFFYSMIGVTGIIVVDLLTFAIAVITLWFVVIPQPSSDGDTPPSSYLWDDFKVALGFLLSHRILFYLMIYAAFLNFFLAGAVNLSTPYIITLTGSEEWLGLLLGVLNLGVVMGGVLMFIHGGTQPRIHGIMGGLMFRAFWLMIYGLARTPLTLGLAMFFLLSTNALIDASFMSLMQTKIPPKLQGRVFALLFQMMFIATPLSYLFTGILVDNIFEPAVQTQGWSMVAPLVGDMAGAGMGLFIFLCGAAILGITIVVYSVPQVRTVEQDMPDYIPQPQPPTGLSNEALEKL